MRSAESAQNASTALSVKNVDFAYSGGDKEASLDVLRNISFAVREGEFVSLLGPSGCGKTTLLRLLAGLLRPGGGEVLIPNFRRRLGYVFQTPNLLPWLNTSDNVTLPLRVQSDPLAVNSNDVSALLDQVGLGTYRGLYPWQLSLGMQMRANLGRALINRPDTLLLDEPFSALDALTALKLQRDVLNIWRKQAVTCILVTHNIVDAVSMSDRVLLLSSRPATIVKEYNITVGRGSDNLRRLDLELDRTVRQILSDMQINSDQFQAPIS